jgi:hypothetical protein
VLPEEKEVRALLDSRPAGTRQSGLRQILGNSGVRRLDKLRLGNAAATGGLDQSGGYVISRRMMVPSGQVFASFLQRRFYIRRNGFSNHQSHPIKFSARLTLAS